jgi:hypothetical protein
MSRSKFQTCSKRLVLELAVEEVLIIEEVNLVHKNSNKDQQNEREHSPLNKSAR